MTNMPWFQFYASDWLAGTRGLSAVETGIYITMIASMYDKGSPLPNDPDRLARLCGATAKQFKPAMERLIEEGKICIVDGGVWNSRVEDELKVRSTKSDKAKLSAESRWNGKTEQNQSSDCANASNSQCERNAIQKPEARSQSSIAKPEPQQPSADPDDFDRLDAALRCIPGVSSHPIAVAPVIAPIWQLVQQGYDFKTEIAPVVADKLRTASGKIKTWSYFVPAIVDGRTKTAGTAKQAATAVDWAKALNTGRRVKLWKPEYGPLPGQAGCLCPAELLQDGDGVDWTVTASLQTRKAA